MKTKEEFYAELWNRAKSNARISRLLVELLVGAPIAIGLCALLFYKFGLNVSFITYFPLYLLFVIFFLLGLTGQSVTKVSEKKIMKNLDKLIKQKEQYYTQAVDEANKEIGRAQERWRDLDHENYLLKKIILDRFDYANPKKE